MIASLRAFELDPHSCLNVRPFFLPVVLSSEDDRVTPYEEGLQLTKEKYIQNGLSVEVLSFEKSRHAAHLNHHPAEYTEFVRRFVERSIMFWDSQRAGRCKL